MTNPSFTAVGKFGKAVVWRVAHQWAVRLSETPEGVDNPRAHIEYHDDREYAVLHARVLAGTVEMR